MPRLTVLLSRILCFVLLFAFVSCSTSNRLDDYLYCRLNSSPTTLDPALITDVQASVIAAKLFNGLVKLDDRLNVVSDIAERWEVSKDGRTYRFYLKKGFLFSTGREVTAQDFKYSFERILKHATKSPNAWIFDNVAGAKSFREGRTAGVEGFGVIDRYEFEINLTSAFSPFLKMLTMTPASVVPREIVEARGADFASNPSGTGPYVLDSWMPNQQVVLKRNDSYSGGAARLKGIVFRIIPEDLTALTEFELGNIDVLQIPSSAYPKLNNDAKWKPYIESIQGLNTYYLGLNTSRPPLDAPLLRKAISLAVDRKKILETFYEGRGRPAEGPVPDLLRTWGSDKNTKVIGYNPVRAKQIVKEHGLTDTRLTLYVAADQEAVDLAEIIQGYLADAGLTVIIRQLEWSAYKSAINRGEPDMFWLSWWADYPDAENFLFPLFDSANLGPAGNRTRYVNRDVDRLIEQGQHSMDQRQRDRIYQKAEEKIISDAPWIFFWHKTDYVIRQPWVSGFKVYPIYNMDKGMDVQVSRHNN
jgi:peptide/nickel transport system substrate-binding protein/oligopeptide transport system substrate-binding protein